MSIAHILATFSCLKLFHEENRRLTTFLVLLYLYQVEINVPLTLPLTFPSPFPSHFFSLTFPISFLFTHLSLLTFTLSLFISHFFSCVFCLSSHPHFSPLTFPCHFTLSLSQLNFPLTLFCFSLYSFTFPPLLFLTHISFTHLSSLTFSLTLFLMYFFSSHFPSVVLFSSHFPHSLFLFTFSSCFPSNPPPLIFPCHFSSLTYHPFSLPLLSTPLTLLSLFTPLLSLYSITFQISQFDACGIKRLPVNAVPYKRPANSADTIFCSCKCSQLKCHILQLN